jgi:predicted AlkP superfamily phosphohydrolase/phosphomutase
MRTVYAAVDDAIGSIVRDAEDAVIVVLSAHGMSSFYGAQFLMRQILAKLGVMTLSPSVPHVEPRWRAAAAALWRRLPAGIRAGLAPIRAAAERHAEPDEVPHLGIDPSRSQCFPLSNGLGSGGIRLNLAGREPAGIVQPGAEADVFVARLTQSLLAIRDLETNAPLVSRVLQPRALYEGPQLDALPDLIVEWNDAIPVGSVHVGGGRGATIIAHSAELGRLEGHNTYGRTGEHRIEGLFVVAGPGVPAVRLTRPVSVLDFAPTFCSLLGVALPNADGAPIAELIPCAHA